MSEPTRIKVYSFWTLESGTENPALAPFKATREAIAKKWTGRLAEGTEQEVESSELDSQGRYRRMATGWGELE